MVFTSNTLSFNNPSSKTTNLYLYPFNIDAASITKSLSASQPTTQLKEFAEAIKTFRRSVIKAHNHLDTRSAIEITLQPFIAVARDTKKSGVIFFQPENRSVDDLRKAEQILLDCLKSSEGKRNQEEHYRSLVVNELSILDKPIFFKFKDNFSTHDLYGHGLNYCRTIRCENTLWTALKTTSNRLVTEDDVQMLLKEFSFLKPAVDHFSEHSVQGTLHELYDACLTQCVHFRVDTLLNEVHTVHSVERKDLLESEIEFLLTDVLIINTAGRRQALIDALSGDAMHNEVLFTCSKAPQDICTRIEKLVEQQSTDWDRKSAALMEDTGLTHCPYAPPQDLFDTLWQRIPQGSLKNIFSQRFVSRGNLIESSIAERLLNHCNWDKEQLLFLVSLLDKKDDRIHNQIIRALDELSFPLEQVKKAARMRIPVLMEVAATKSLKNPDRYGTTKEYHNIPKKAATMGIEEIIRKGIELNVWSEEELTEAFSAACENKHLSIAHLLVGIIPVEETNFLPAFLAAAAGDGALVKILVDRGALINVSADNGDDKITLYGGFRDHNTSALDVAKDTAKAYLEEEEKEKRPLHYFHRISNQKELSESEVTWAIAFLDTIIREHPRAPNKHVFSPFENQSRSPSDLGKLLMHLGYCYEQLVVNNPQVSVLQEKLIGAFEDRFLNAVRPRVGSILISLMNKRDNVLLGKKTYDHNPFDEDAYQQAAALFTQTARRYAEKNISLNINSFRAVTPLAYAVSYKNIDDAQLLFELGARLAHYGTQEGVKDSLIRMLNVERGSRSPSTSTMERLLLEAKYNDAGQDQEAYILQRFKDLEALINKITAPTS